MGRIIKREIPAGTAIQKKEIVGRAQEKDQSAYFIIDGCFPIEVVWMHGEETTDREYDGGCVPRNES